MIGLMLRARTAAVAACSCCLTLAARPAPAQSAAAQAGVVAPVRAPAPSSADSSAGADTLRRPRAVEYSDWYGRRLTIHRVGSYTMLPLFAGTYLLGDRLLNESADPSWVKSAHVTGAWGAAALFGVNSVTGVWNLWDARHDAAGRPRRFLHSALMLAADAGFVYTASLAEDAEGEDDEDEGGGGGSRFEDRRGDARRHRNAALVSMGISVAGTAMMWLWKE